MDTWLRSQGFQPHCLLDLKRWSISPTIRDGNFRIPFNQLLESDIVYIRDPLNLEVVSAEQLRKLALMAHHMFNGPDLCVHLLKALIERGTIVADAHQRYLQTFRKAPTKPAT